MKNFILLMFASLLFFTQGVASENFKVEIAQFEYSFDADVGSEFISTSDFKVQKASAESYFYNIEQVPNEAQIKEPFDYSENRYLINNISENTYNFKQSQKYN